MHTSTMQGEGAPGTEAAFLTDRLLLRSWRVTDATVQRQLWVERDPRAPARRRISADGHPSVMELEDRIRRDDGTPPPGLLAVELKSSGQVIGYCGLIHNSNALPEEPELAFEFLRRFWNQGFATEACWAIVEQARVLGYPRLGATVRDWNAASRRVLGKLEFVETGRVEPDREHGALLFTTKVFAAGSA